MSSSPSLSPCRGDKEKETEKERERETHTERERETERETETETEREIAFLLGVLTSNTVRNVGPYVSPFPVIDAEIHAY